MSSFLEGRVPEGGALLSVFVGDVRRSAICSLDDREMEEILSSEMTSMLGPTVFEPDILRIMRCRHAIQQYGARRAASVSAPSPRLRSDTPAWCRRVTCVTG